MSTAVVPSLHGRGAELGVRQRCLDVVASGRAQTAFVEGEPGIGKTRLLAEVAAAATRRGMRVFVGAAEELERHRPFGALAEAVGCRPDASDSRRVALAALLAGGAVDQTDSGLQFRALDAFVTLLEAEALASPLVLVMDDLQWADQSTLLALRAVGRRLRFVPVLLLGAFRPTPLARYECRPA